MQIPPISSQPNRATSHALAENIESHPQSLVIATLSKPEPAISFPLVLMLLFITSAYLIVFIGSLFLISRREEPLTQKQSSTPAYSTDHPLYFNLLNLLNGDRSTANRLLQQACTNYPNQSEEWRYEKVIWDLVRDRLP